MSQLISHQLNAIIQCPTASAEDIEIAKQLLLIHSLGKEVADLLTINLRSKLNVGYVPQNRNELSVTVTGMFNTGKTLLSVLISRYLHSVGINVDFQDEETPSTYFDNLSNEDIIDVFTGKVEGSLPKTIFIRNKGFTQPRSLDPNATQESMGSSTTT